MSALTRPPGQITTFYSYKGGTGRTMLLANVAWILASAGKRVLAIDWDLEAPGLHHYFHPFLVDPDLKATDGLIDMVVDYGREAVTPEEQSDGLIWLDRAADLRRYVAGIDWRFPNDGQLHLVPAGQQSAAFSVRVNTFDWQHFYDRLNGGAFLELVKKKIKNDYDHILIDSRTGVSDTSGICTVQMPDQLVVCFTASEQSIKGSAIVAASVSSQWARLDNSSGDNARHHRIFPILMRTEASEKEKLDAARAHVREVFGRLPGLSQSDESYWNRAEVGYWPFYAFEEVLAVFGDQFRTDNSLLAACEHVAGLITDGAVAQFVQPEPTQRQHVLAAYERRTDGKSEAAVRAAQQAQRLAQVRRRAEEQARVETAPRRWYLSYHSADEAVAAQLKGALERKDAVSRIFFAPMQMRAGGSWSAQLAQEIAEANAFILLIGQSGIGKWQVTEYDEAIDKWAKSPSDFSLVVILLEGQTAPGLPFLRQFNWIVTPDPASEKCIALIFDVASGGGTTPSELWRHTFPYRGLEAMEEQDSDYFFGRTRETVAVLSTLTAPERLPVLIGNSGVGKSSLAQAGVLAALKRQAWPEQAGAPDPWPTVFRHSRQWCFLSLKPGTDPLRVLVECFLDTWRYAATDPERVTRQHGWIELLLDGKATLSDLIDATERRRQELSQPKPPAFFLYIDQGEELYVRAEQRQRRRFSELVARALSDSRLRVMMSMRSDFVGFLQNDEPLFSARQYIEVPPLREAALREIVSRPAELLSVRFETDSLIDIISQRAAEDSVKDVGALPLLSYTLDDMWISMVRRGDGTLRLPAKPFELGGVLVDRANRFLETHPGAEDALRRVLTLQLATVREDGELTRRRAARAEFTDIEWRLVSELADYPNRLLVTATSDAGETYAEVASEAIFRRWDKLREWINAEREFLAWRNQLDSQRRLWETVNKRRDALLMGFSLTQAQKWAATRSEDLTSSEKEFINLSIKQSTWRRWLP